MNKKKPIVGNASRTKMIEQRRRMLLEIIMSDPTRKWTYRKLALEAQKLPWFQEHMPDYGFATAYRDYLAVQKETKERREQLAEQYLVAQLDALDEGLTDIATDLTTLGGLDEMITLLQEDIKGDPDAAFDRLAQITKFVKAKEALYNTAIRLMKRQGNLVPMETPKQVTVNQTRVNIDLYREMLTEHKAEKELEDGVTVDGTFEEV